MTGTICHEEKQEEPRGLQMSRLPMTLLRRDLIAERAQEALKRFVRKHGATPGELAIRRQAERERQPLPVSSAAVKEFGPALEQATKRLWRKRVLLRWSLALKPAATRFLRHVEQAERARTKAAKNQVATKDYRRAGALLRRYFRKEIEASEFCDEVNLHLGRSPVTWKLSPVYGGRGARKMGPRFRLDRGEGWVNAWPELARLLSDGTTLERFKMCTVPECARLFYDASPPGQRTACSTQHKNILAARRYRQRRAGKGERKR